MPTRRQQLAAAWDALAKAGRDGPLDARTTCLLELATAIGTGNREAIRATHQRATQIVHAEEIDQVVALAAPIVGRFAAESVYAWLGLEPPAAPGVPARGNPKPTDA